MTKFSAILIIDAVTLRSFLRFLLAAPLVAAGVDIANAQGAADAVAIRFTITKYVVEGATAVGAKEINKAVAPYVGKDRDFSDVQRALEAVEALYAKHGFTAVNVLLPEQELQQGVVRFRVIEGRLGKVSVSENRFVSTSNALRALPAVRTGAVPQNREIARDLKHANENPARQLNVVLKAGAKEDEVDANVVVTDRKPVFWGISIDNSGTSETGKSRLGLSWRHANLFDADHVMGLQYQTSPEDRERVQVLGLSYKVPFYRAGGSLDLFLGDSNVNAATGGLAEFQGGGRLFSARYTQVMLRQGVFDPRWFVGIDWRRFRRLELTGVPPTVLYDEIVVTPLSVGGSTQGRFERSELALNLAVSANFPGASRGKKADFANYDLVSFSAPDARYWMIKYGASYAAGGGWQLRAAVNGQRTGDILVKGEQFRLGGADGVRGFAEGSEGGDSGARGTVEAYFPEFGAWGVRMRALVFRDAGRATTNSDSSSASISSAGLGLRVNYTDTVALRIDAAQILKAAADPKQQVGDRHAHMSLNVTF